MWSSRPFSTRSTARRPRGRPAAALAPALLVAALGCGEDPHAPNTPDAVPAPVTAEAATAGLAFRQVSGSGYHTCAVTTADVAYCWGLNASGELGDGSTTLYRSTPVAVAGGLKFRLVTAGVNHTCAVTTDDHGYCWGRNDWGQLGDGTTTAHATPVPVAGGRLFRRVEAGDFHTCGLSAADGRAYCWGNNGNGQLGDGSTTVRLTPTAVLGGRTFRAVSAGGGHSCAVTTADVAYCWGSNQYGQLGDSTNAAFRAAPVQVAGGHLFRQVDAGRNHTCGVTRTSRAYCWGYGRHGEIGDGKTYLRFTPRLVAGGLSFERVTAGAFHVCGETTLNRAYCWGDNGNGQLGDGTTVQRLTPVAVLGGLFFSQVSAGDAHTCGVSSDARAYCWGYNQYGQLGDGTTIQRLTPTRVVGP